MKFVVAPDSYKESLSALQVARTIAEVIGEIIPTANIEVVPMADGGEGTVEALAAAVGGVIQFAEVTGPLGHRTQAAFSVLTERDSEENGEMTAVLEAASIFGLSLVPENDRDPYNTTTRGMGELVLQLLDQGIRKFIIGLGGSATNDGGMGLLAALGARFYDQYGKQLKGYGKDLLEVKRISVESLDSRLTHCNILIASDVQNPLCGSHGASVIYGPQKGATPAQVTALDVAMEQYANELSAALGRSMKDLSGAGAAGGAGFALLMLGAAITSGAEAVADAVKLKTRIAGADWVITGEGSSDYQTRYGKLPIYVARLAREAGVRTILLSGSLGVQAVELEQKFTACFACVPRPMSLPECIEEAERNLRSTARNIIRLLSPQ